VVKSELNLSISEISLREIGPILRRFFTNTLFDSTFMLLGVIIGSAFSPNPDLRLIIGTLVTSSIALGISTGVSVYESETMERERKIVEMEKALFRKLDNTTITRSYRMYAIVLSLLNFLTPLVCCGIVVVPLVLSATNLLALETASWTSVGLSLAILFVAGIYLGRQGKKNPALKGIRMVLFGVAAFIIGYLIQTVI
jgi:predicted membrane protein (TIGR00267 family)